MSSPVETLDIGFLAVITAGGQKGRSGVIRSEIFVDFSIFRLICAEVCGNLQLVFTNLKACACIRVT